jgi:hypothetical protein
LGWKPCVACTDELYAYSALGKKSSQSSWASSTYRLIMSFQVLWKRSINPSKLGWRRLVHLHQRQQLSAVRRLLRAHASFSPKLLVTPLVDSDPLGLTIVTSITQTLYLELQLVTPSIFAVGAPPGTDSGESRLLGHQAVGATSTVSGEHVHLHFFVRLIGHPP